QPGVRLCFTLAELSLQPGVQLVHYRPAVLLMKPQSLIRYQPALTCLSIMTIHLAQHVQHVAALVGKIRRHFHKLPSTMSKAIRHHTLPSAGTSGTLRDSASHIWIGAGSPAARRLNTPAMFSPACWRPVKYSAIFRPSPVDTIPLVNPPVRSSTGSRASRNTRMLVSSL